jgi:hypothetical protein
VVPLDLLGVAFVSISLIVLFLQRRSIKALISGTLLLGWVTVMLIWWFVIIPQDLLGDLGLFILWLMSELLLFSGLLGLMSIILDVEQYQLAVRKNKRITLLYARVFLFYLVIQLTTSLAVALGNFVPFLLFLLELSFIVKFLILPVCGVVIFGGTIFLLTGTSEKRGERMTTIDP